LIAVINKTLYTKKTKQKILMLGSTRSHIKVVIAMLGMGDA
jgi:hypothetical protein